jgi:hypothetical protein
MDTIIISREYVYNGTVRREEGVGYKVMYPDWIACGKFQYQVGKTYSMKEEELVLREWGFHYCEHPIDCLRYYDLVPENKFSQVKIHGKVVRNPVDDIGDLDDKCATNIIEIDKEISFEDWLELCTVSVTIFVNNRKYVEQTYVKGILDKKLIYFLQQGEEKTAQEDVLKCSYTRVFADQSEYRYNLEQYRENKTLKERSYWSDSETQMAYRYENDGKTICSTVSFLTESY